jgi:S1-C subfamily serine protease
MFCKNCGKEISDSAKFCKYCGQYVSKDENQLRATESSGANVNEGKSLAGFWIRAGAFIFDYGLITIIWGVIWAFVEWPEYYDGITEYFLLFLYHSLFLSRISTTPGKKLFGLRVADASSGGDLTIGRAFGRTLSYALSSILLGLGFLSVAWHKRKQGWHDLLAKTVVIRKQKKLLLPILSTVLLWTILGGLAWYGDDTYYYSGLPGESIIKSLDDFLSDKPANFQELFYAGFGADEEKYEIKVVAESEKQKTSQEIASENKDTIVFIRTDEGIGSGFFISPDGLIATNYHVVANASQVGVQTSDGSQHLVTSVVDFDVAQDFAVIKVDVSNTSYVALGDSDSVELGEDVVVIGNPEGLSNSVTRGIVSSTLREIEGGEYIQIDASISAGSSGGPIYDSHGQVIGIATLYLTEGQNLNFGVPINKIFDEVLVRGVVNDRSTVQVKEEAETVTIPQQNTTLPEEEPDQPSDADFVSLVSDAYYQVEFAYENASQCLKPEIYEKYPDCNSVTMSTWQDRQTTTESDLRDWVRKFFSHIHGRNPNSSEETSWFQRIIKSDVTGADGFIRKLRFYEAQGSTLPG